MSRELINHLKAKNEKRRAEIVRLEAEYLPLHQNHAWLDDEEIVTAYTPLTDNETEVKAKLFELSGSILTNKARLKLAYVFLLRHNKGLVPTLCSECFVEHDRKESLMVEEAIDPKFGDHKKQYKCEKCGHVLRVDPTLNIQ